MFKKSVKRGVAVLLTLILLLTSLPLTAFAETTTASTGTKDDYIYNSDLFFGYSAYLTETYNAALLSLEQHRMQTTYNIIHQDYSDNTNVGEATIIINGIGNYTGSQTVTFNIYREHNYSVIDQGSYLYTNRLSNRKMYDLWQNKCV